MKNTLISFAAGAAVCATLALSLGFTQPVEDAAAAAPTEEEMAAMMAQMAEMAAPSEGHAMLDHAIGHWNAKAEFEMGGPEPLVATGSMHSEWVMDGRYTMTKFKLDDFMGQPFHGIALMGYSNYTKQYMGSWIDTMSTHMTTTKGNVDGDGMLVMSGTSVTPMGQAGMRIVTEFVDQDTMIDRFFDEVAEDTWVQSGTITYTRVQEGG